MPFVHEIQIVSTGFIGAPGYTNLYFETTVGADHDPQFTAARGLLLAIANLFPNTWSGKINPSGRILESTTGILGSFTTAPAAAQPPVGGVGTDGYGAGVAGAVIGWGTATVKAGRVIRGRTFAVPLAVAAYQADGTLSPGALVFLNDGASNLIASNTGFCIWSRPKLGVGGVTAPVLTRRVNDRAAFLSSRRS